MPPVGLAAVVLPVISMDKRPAGVTFNAAVTPDSEDLALMASTVWLRYVLYSAAVTVALLATVMSAPAITTLLSVNPPTFKLAVALVVPAKAPKALTASAGSMGVPVNDEELDVPRAAERTSVSELIAMV